ncbi:MAG TPA: MFS transporter [Candidatus Dormibacteraeota bacterium]|nr:MFS transporter [Candidatus Dormibacteraeota bacterium]
MTAEPQIGAADVVEPIAAGPSRLPLPLLVPAIFLLALNLRMGISSVGPVLPQVVHDLGTTLVYASLLTTAPVVMMGLASPLSARVGARFGLERAIVGAIAVVCIATGLRYWAHSPLFLLATAVLLGCGIAAGNTMLPAVVRRYFPAHGALMTGVYAVGINAGAGVAAFGTPRLALILPSTWQSALAIWAGVAALALALWVVIVARSPRQPLGVRIALPQPTRQAWLAAGFFGVQSIIYYGVLAWLAPLYEERGWSKVGAGLLLSFFTAMQVIGALTCSLLVQRTGRLAEGLRATGAVAGLGLLLVALSPTSLTWLWMVILGLGVGGIFPLTLTVPLAMTSSVDAARSLTSTMLFYGYLLAATGPFIVSLLRSGTGSFTTPFLLLAALAGAEVLLAHPLVGRQGVHTEAPPGAG